MKKYRIIEAMKGNKYGTYDEAPLKLNFRYNIDKYGEGRFELPIFITDYRGGLIDTSSIQSVYDTNQNNMDEVETNARKIRYEAGSSDAILVLLDAIQLSLHRDNLAACRERLNIDEILMDLQNLRQLKRKGVSVYIVLTKVDAVTEDLKTNGYEGLINIAKQLLKGFYNYAQILEYEDGWTIGFIPVTAVGEGNTTTDWDGKSTLIEGKVPAQENIDLTLAAVVSTALQKRISLMNEKINQIGEEYNIDVVNERTRGFFDRRPKKEMLVEVKKMKAVTNNFQICKSLIDQGYNNKFITVIKR